MQGRWQDNNECECFHRDCHETPEPTDAPHPTPRPTHAMACTHGERRERLTMDHSDRTAGLGNKTISPDGREGGFAAHRGRCRNPCRSLLVSSRHRRNHRSCYRSPHHRYWNDHSPSYTHYRRGYHSPSCNQWCRKRRPRRSSCHRTCRPHHSSSSWQQHRVLPAPSAQGEGTAAKAPPPPVGWAATAQPRLGIRAMISSR